MLSKESNSKYIGVKIWFVFVDMSWLWVFEKLALGGICKKDVGLSTVFIKVQLMTLGKADSVVAYCLAF